MEKVSDLIKNMKEDNSELDLEQLKRISDNLHSISTQYNYSNRDIKEVVNNPEEFIIPEILPACKLLWDKGIETYMCGNYDDTDGRWIELARLSDENKKIFEELMKVNNNYLFVHHYTIRVPFGPNEIKELCDLISPFVYQDTTRYQRSSEFLESFKKTGGELYVDSAGQIHSRLNPLYENTTFEQALILSGKENLYDQELDRVYDDELFLEWHKNFIKHSSRQL